MRLARLLTPPEAHQLWTPWRIISREGSNQDRVNRHLDWVRLLGGGEVRCRENIPLAVMCVISLAILFVFGVSEATMRDMPRQHDGCGGPQQVAISPAWPLPSSGLTDLSAPASPPLPTSRLPGLTGCTKSSTTAIG
jgi:hypothetical protein